MGWLAKHKLAAGFFSLVLVLAALVLPWFSPGVLAAVTLDPPQGVIQALEAVMAGRKPPVDNPRLQLATTYFSEHGNPQAIQRVLAAGDMGFATAGQRHHVQGRDVILVYGLNSSPAIWRSMVEALLPVYGADHVYVYVYNDFQPIVKSGQELAQLVKEKHLKKVDLIGHSLGGLVIRSAIDFYGLPGADHVVTLATPNGGLLTGETTNFPWQAMCGSVPTTVSAWAACSSHLPVPIALAARSPLLMLLNAPHYQDIHYAELGATLPVGASAGQAWLDTDGVVPVDSAVADLSNQSLYPVHTKVVRGWHTGLTGQPDVVEWVLKILTGKS